jgi:hypothetical protein
MRERFIFRIIGISGGNYTLLEMRAESIHGQGSTAREFIVSRFRGEWKNALGWKDRIPRHGFGFIKI